MCDAFRKYARLSSLRVKLLNILSHPHGVYSGSLCTNVSPNTKKHAWSQYRGFGPW